MFTRQELESLEPYSPGEQPNPTEKVIKLNTNENPYPPSPKAWDKIQEIWKLGSLRKYPHFSSRELSQAIASRYNLKEEQILVTNGSDEALRLLFFACLASGDTVVCPDPTYSYYQVLVDQVMNGSRIQKIPLLSNLHFDFANLSKAKGKLLAFAHPNAPTGIREEKDSLLDLVSSFSGIVLSDEAYIDFAKPGSSLVTSLKDCPNLVVSRTFSKSYSLAGIRVGFLMGSEENIFKIKKLKDSYNVGTLEQAIAKEAFLDSEYFEACLEKVLRERTRLKQALETLGFEIPPSETNFLFCKPSKGVSPKNLYLGLKERKVLIRYFGTGISKDFIRITIGSQEENSALLQALEDLLQSGR